MNVPAYAIGLPEEWVAEIKQRAEVRYIAQSPVVPRVFARSGQTFIESYQTPGRFLQPNIVLWYGYFPNSTIARQALAVSNTPTFPNVRRTLPWDDKMLSVVMVQEVDEKTVPRGYLPPTASGYPEPSWDRNTVLKWGNSHCGENKILLRDGIEPLIVEATLNSLLSEPFVDGESHRILIVGDHTSQLVYDAVDWRKNVNGKITKLRTVDPDLSERTHKITGHYGLAIAGVDYVIGRMGTMLLEVNTYPSLDEDDEAREHFFMMAAEAVRKAQPKDA